MNNNVKSLYHLERILCILIIVCFFVPWINIIGVGLSGLFLETHPTPDSAPSDGPNMVPLDDLGDMLERIVKIRDLLETLD